MKLIVLIGATVALCVGVAAFALHFELSARTHAYTELRELSGQTQSDLLDHRITQSRASAVDGRLDQARLALKEDDVRGAQRLLDHVKATLDTRARAA
ncbi:MAG: hypothetical protein KGL14_01435 [Gammaproteobacteria bacterium]|nr:hypothetical protein [Gammaproteobacteria bacterium]